MNIAISVSVIYISFDVSQESWGHVREYNSLIQMPHIQDV